ncbi:hypothetical protein L484_013227 [Morus notabilis]|uniref:Uncharacterized protein n=1 Tax=Morus notabilis TaxID=981085 RepID=W9SBQ8_9ROSA|nr:hypothetical protein L484_013227 [Morus notabilis]
MENNMKRTLEFCSLIFIKDVVKMRVIRQTKPIYAKGKQVDTRTLNYQILYENCETTVVTKYTVR